MKKDLLSIWEFLREFQPLCIGVLDSKEEKKREIVKKLRKFLHLFDVKELLDFQ